MTQQGRQVRMLLVLIAAGVGSVLTLLRTPFSDDLYDLLPLRDSVIADQYGFMQAVGGGAVVMGDVRTAPGETPLPFDSLAAIATAVRQAIDTSRLMASSLSGSPATFLDLRALLVRNWGAGFTVQDSQWLASRMVPDTLQRRFDQTLASLFVISDEGGSARDLQIDPFGFSPRLLERLSFLRPGSDVDFEQGFLTNPARSAVALPFHLRDERLSSQEGVLVSLLMSTGERIAQERGARFTWMGAVRAAADNRLLVRRDINHTAPLSIALIAGICLLIYRRFSRGLLVFIPTILGILVAAALVSRVLPLSLITLGFAAALVGITVDYAIHYFYHTESLPCDAHPGRTLAPAIGASALTTASAFTVLAFSSIPALTQLGVLTGVGIVLVAFFSLRALPVLFPPSILNAPPPRVDLEALFAPLMRSPLLRPAAVGVVLVSVLLWAAVPRLVFDADPDTLNGMTPQTRAAQRSLEQNWPSMMGSTFLVVQGATANEALERMEEGVVAVVEELADSALLAVSPLPMSALLPSRRTQQRNRERWERFWTSERRALLEEALAAVAPRYRLTPQPFAPYLHTLTRAEEHTLDIDSLDPHLRSGPLRTHLAQGEGVWYGAVPLPQAPEAVQERRASIARGRGVQLINSATLGIRLLELVREGFMRALLLVPLVVIAVLVLVLRSLRLVAIAALPPFCSAGMTLGFMALNGRPVTLVSGMVLAFVFGVGIDYAVFLVHSLRADPHDGRAGARGAASITIAALTTVAGLGVMGFARHPVLSSLGVHGVMGILASYLSALVLVPTLMAPRRTLRTPGHTQTG